MDIKLQFVSMVNGKLRTDGNHIPAVSDRYLYQKNHCLTVSYDPHNQPTIRHFFPVKPMDRRSQSNQVMSDSTSTVVGFIH